MAPQPCPYIRELTPYAWEAFANEVASAAGIDESEIVRFDLNTVPWPPIAWEQTVLDLPRMPVNEYPHPSNEPLRSLLAERLGVTPGQVVVTSGADEALFLLASAFVGPGRRAVALDPSFSMFRVVTEGTGGALLRVPVNESWDVPREALRAALSESNVSLAFLCSPNNPTGRLIPADLIADMARSFPDTLIVADEAYYEIAGVTVAPLLAEHPNLVIVRTFSKAYGLAGARVGYAVGRPDVIDVLESIRLPQNLSAFGVTAAVRAFSNQTEMESRVAELRSERENLEHALQQRGWDTVPSEANFLLGRPPVSALDLGVWLQGAGLIVRSYEGHPRLNDWLRVTVRSPAENARLLSRMDSQSA